MRQSNHNQPLHQRIEWVAFLKNGISMPVNTGAIFPSSRSLSLEMIRPIDFSQKVSILEIGPGTGAISGEIARRIQTGSQFTGIELNEKFVFMLRKKHPQFDWLCGSAEKADVLTGQQCSFDHIVCSLPWTIFPEKLQVKILEAIQKTARPGSSFSTFAYLHGKNLKGGKRFASLLHEYFPDFSTSRAIWRNIPPAVVYHGKAR